MATFTYLVVDKAGKKKKGNLDADSRAAAMDELKRNGGTVVSLDEVGMLSKSIDLSFISSKPTPRDLAVFCRQIVSILDAGVPAITALGMLSEQTENKKLAKALAECKTTIEKGESIAEAMRLRSDVFPSMLVTLVEAGEASGSLTLSFSRMAEQFEKDAKIKATVKKASIYPTFILIVAFAASVVMLTFVVPSFESMLDSLGTKMPALTAVILSIAKFLQHAWYVLFAVIFVLVVGLRAFSKTKNGRYFFGKLSLKAPLIGQLTVKTASARLARTLGTLLGAGLPLIDSLGIVSNTMTNVYFRDSVTAACEAVTLGAPLSTQFKKCGLFPPLVYHMIGIGEETGAMESMLNKLAEYYEEEVESATERVLAAIEPAIIVVMAVIIGTIVISIVLPMSSMYSGLSNL